MIEYDIYLPDTRPDGTPPAAGKMQAIKEQLVRAFGGYTHLQSRMEGMWKMGGVSFRDAITILRVLDEGDAAFDMGAFKKQLEVVFEQESVLIVAKEVRAI